MSEHGEAEYVPVMSFWLDAGGYSERDKEMFVCGFEFAWVYELAKTGKLWDQCIHTENSSRVRMMCGKLGVPCELELIDETWTKATIGRKPPQPPDISLSEDA